MEILIDFREIIGPHTGENMAECVWQTMSYYHMIDKVRFCQILALPVLTCFIRAQGSEYCRR
jgi:hypothetical protein